MIFINRIFPQFLSPLLVTGRSLLVRSTATIAHPSSRFYTAQPTENATETENASQQPAQADDEVEKLYSRLEIELRGSDPAVMRSYQKFAVTSAEHLGIEVGRV